MLDPTLNWTIALCLVLLWSAAAWDKIHAREWFARVLAAYRLLPTGWSPAIAVLLPAVELAIAIGLLIPGCRRQAAQLGAAMLLLYSLAIAVNLLRGRRDFDCGCHPGHDQPVSWLLVLRNMVFCALSLSLLLPLSGRQTDSADLLLALLATVIVCTTYLFIMSIKQERDSSDNIMD
jgi:Methylamine utilisation protein MauE